MTTQTLNLTENELAILKGARINEYCDAYESTPWVFSVIDYSKLDAKVARGVISSLVKKDLIQIEDYEGNNNPDDMILHFTKKAKELCDQGII